MQKKLAWAKTQNPNYSIISLILNFFKYFKCVLILHLNQLIYKGESNQTTNWLVPQELTTQFQPSEKASTPELLRTPKPTYITVSCF
jgi:hypothetical protein